MATGLVSGLVARMILDSRGIPTIEADVYVDGVLAGRAAVPSGASTGKHEAVERRDGGKDWGGKGVEVAVDHVLEVIQPAIVGMPVTEQELLDETILSLDGSQNKSELGANAILAVSLACLHGGANTTAIPLWRYVGGLASASLPVPLMNILNGGAHAATRVDIQEFMVIPHGFDDFGTALRAGTDTYHALRSVLNEEGLLTGVGDEGGFAPDLSTNEKGLEMLVRAIQQAGYVPGSDLSIALDVAASEFYDGKTYSFDGDKIGSDALADIYVNWIEEYPIVSIEDGFAEDDWSAWVEFTKRAGNRIQIVGDDLFVTNIERLARGIEEKAANAILVKPNQIGTVTETLETVRLAKNAGFSTIMSHRSGETEDVSIADLAVGCGCGQIKTGAPARSDRTAKYNQLLRIAEEVEGFDPHF